MNKNLNTNRPSECERFAHCVWHDKRAIIFEQRGDARFNCRMILSMMTTMRLEQSMMTMRLGSSFDV